VFLMHDYLCSISLDLLYIFVVILVFEFCFLSTCQEIGWEEHLRNDLFCIEWFERLELSIFRYCHVILWAVEPKQALYLKFSGKYSAKY